MHFSKTADHALRAVLFLAGADGPVPADRIADALGAPRNYLAKTLQGLSRAGIVEGRRGPTGGFVLRVPPHELSLDRVIGAFDERVRRESCLMGDHPCRDTEPCDAHRAWTALVDNARRPLRRTTVADLVEGRCSLLDGPRTAVTSLAS